MWANFCERSFCERNFCDNDDRFVTCNPWYQKFVLNFFSWSCNQFLCVFMHVGRFTEKNFHENVILWYFQIEGKAVLKCRRCFGKIFFETLPKSRHFTDVIKIVTKLVIIVFITSRFFITRIQWNKCEKAWKTRGRDGLKSRLCRAE